MRRVVGCVLIGLGVALLALAPFLRFYVYDRLLVTPIDQYAWSVAPGTGSYLNAGNGEMHRNVDMVARRVLFPYVKAATSKVAVWNETVTLMTTADKVVVNASRDRVAFDRKTAMAVNCCGENVDGKPVKHQGIGYKFPFNSEKTSYPFFDTVAKKAFPRCCAARRAGGRAGRG